MREAFIKLHISVILGGITGIFGKLITLSEGVLVWYRMLITTILFYLILKIGNHLFNLPTRNKLRISIVGLVLALHWVFFYGSIKAANVSVAVVCFSTIGIFTALFEPLLDKKPFSWKEIALGGISLVGVLFIFQFETRYRLGISLGIISAALAALYTILMRKEGSDLPSGTVLLYVIGGGFLSLTLLMPLYLWIVPQEVLYPDMKNLLYLLLFSFFCTICLYILQIQALKKISAFTVNLSYNLEPVYSILLAMLLFDEAKELNFSFYIGLGLILLSMMLQTARIARQTKRNKIITTT